MTTTQTFPALRVTDDFVYRVEMVPAGELTSEDFAALSAGDRARAVPALAAIGVVVVWSAEFGYELVDANDVEAAIPVAVLEAA